MPELTTELNDAELSRKVALACGWRECEFYVETGRISLTRLWGHRQDMTDEQIGHKFDGRCLGADQSGNPHFATSLDACFGPGGPVEYAKAQGWRFWLQWEENDGTFEAQFGFSIVEPCGHRSNEQFFRGDDVAARALCLAFLEAVEASK